MEFCPYCGSAITSDVLFCPSCGTDLSAAWELELSSQPQASAPDMTEGQDSIIPADAATPMDAVMPADAAMPTDVNTFTDADILTDEPADANLYQAENAPLYDAAYESVPTPAPTPAPAPAPAPADARNVRQQGNHYSAQYAPAPHPKSSASKYVAIAAVCAALTLGGIFAYMYFGPGLPWASTSTPAAQDTDAQGTDTQDTSIDQQSSTTQDTQDTSATATSPSASDTTTEETYTFSSEWYGYLDGVVDQEVVGVPFTLSFTQVNEDGSLSGICYVDNYGSYYVDGNINWSTGSITINARDWANQGTLTVRRNFTGTISSDFTSMSGDCVGIDGRHESSWDAVAL